MFHLTIQKAKFILNQQYGKSHSHIISYQDVKALRSSPRAKIIIFVWVDHMIHQTGVGQFRLPPPGVYICLTPYSQQLSESIFVQVRLLSTTFSLICVCFHTVGGKQHCRRPGLRISLLFLYSQNRQSSKYLESLSSTSYT